MDDFLTKMKDYLDRGVEVSKDALVKAGEKVQDFGGKSVTRIEITQLESKVQKEIQKLGVYAYTAFAENGKDSITKEDSDTAAILAEIAKTKSEIEQKKLLLANEPQSENFSEKK